MFVPVNQVPFPKPPPAEPLPLKEWLKLTDRAEVGRESFFRGRDSEYKVFRDAVSSLGEGSIGGGTMIFQGAPGAGKTALMNECMEAVRQHSTLDAPWVAVSVNPASLQFPGTVVSAIVTAINAENRRLLEHLPDTRTRWLKKVLNEGEKLLHEMASWNLSIEGVSLSKKEHAASAQQLFIHASSLLKNYHAVVFVDEAQNTPDTPPTKDVLDCLHRDTQGIPLIAAFFGLSDTQSVLGQCGLSRLPKDRVVTLDTLSLADARSAIQGVFDSYGSGDSGEAEWIDALTDLSQGWPQHINSVSVAALRVLNDHGGSIHEDLLLRAIRLGKELKEEYYTHRLAACSGEPWVYKKLAQEAQDRNGVLSWDEIDELTQFARSKKQQSTDDFLIDALHAGVLVETRKLPKHYEIPIPSLGDYLRELPVRSPF